MRRGKGRGHYELFLPYPRVTLSVVRTAGMTAAQVRSIGVEYVCATVKGHATTLASVVFDHCAGLSFIADGDPFPQHAAIVGWAEVEAQARSYAARMADVSELVEY